MIDFDKKYNEKSFLEFWRRYNNIYNNIHKPTEQADDVEIYYNNQIGIINEPALPNENEEKGTGTPGNSNHTRKYNILHIIEQRNKEEEEIGDMIKNFEEKIDHFFEFIKTDEKGIRLVLKINSIGKAFNEAEVLSDFEKLYNKFKRRFKVKIGEYFFLQTKDLVEKLFEDFEQSVKAS